MVLLQVSPETDTPRQRKVNKFPCRLGRAESNDLQLSDPGIWADHCWIDLDRTVNQFRFHSCPNALCFINGTPAEETPLRNGDLIQIGGCRIVFTLAPAPQGALALRQATVWLVVVLAILLQASLVLFLNRF